MKASEILNSGKVFRLSLFVLIAAIVLSIAPFGLAVLGIRHRLVSRISATERSILLDPLRIGFVSFYDPFGGHTLFADRSDLKWLDNTKVEQDTERSALLFGWYRSRISGSFGYTTAWSVFVPYYPFAILGAIVPLIRLKRWLPRRIAWSKLQRARRLRLLLGRCDGCGYDLHEARGRCPECGRAVRMIRVSLPPRPKRTVHA